MGQKKAGDAQWLPHVSDLDDQVKCGIAKEAGGCNFMTSLRFVSFLFVLCF